MELTDHSTGKTGIARRKKTSDFSSIIYGKIPPQAKDLEESVLGAIMIEKEAIDKALELLTPEMFYVDSHQRIFKAMVFLSQKHNHIDILTVAEELKKREELDMCGGPYYVTKLTNSVVGSAHIETHSKIIFQKYLQREIIRVGGEMVSEAYEDGINDPFDLLDKVEKEIFSVTSRLYKRDYLGLDTLIVNAIKEIELVRHDVDKQKISGITSGFPSIDKLTHGWQKEDLIILAARPSVGKTAFALNLARNAAINGGWPVAFFSMEMSAGQLTKRLLSSESEIWYEKIVRGRIEDDDMRTIYTKAVQVLAKAPIFIDDSPALNIYELRAKCRKMKNKHNVELIVIDYLQLMSGTGSGRQNREQEIAEISRGLKGLAKELSVPIIALSQLSRETEKRATKTPQLSDLRESGAIEQDADTVMFMYRPEYYGISRDDMGQSNPGETEIKFAKHRNGTLETIKLKAVLHIQKFIEGGGQLHLPSNTVARGQQASAGDIIKEDLPF